VFCVAGSCCCFCVTGGFLVVGGDGYGHVVLRRSMYVCRLCELNMKLLRRTFELIKVLGK